MKIVLLGFFVGLLVVGSEPVLGRLIDTLETYFLQCISSLSIDIGEHLGPSPT